MKILLISSILLTLSSIPYPVARANPVIPGRTIVTDSVGVEKKGGKRFIIHRVDEGQTLYAIARKYNRSVADIRAANPDLSESVKYGQMVRIPSANAPAPKPEKAAKRETITKLKADPKPTTTEAKPGKNESKDVKKTDDPARAGIHVVEPSQTLYSLASRYGISQADLRKWNNLSGNNVLIGQALIVSEKAYQARMPSTPTPTVAAKTPEPSPRNVVHPSEPRPATPSAESHPTEPRPTPSSESKPEHRPDGEATNRPRTEPETPNRPVTTPPTSDNRSPAKDISPEAEIELPRPGNDAPMPTRGRRISASGIAEMIEGTDDSGKYLALHRTAPIGTLVQVRNEFNNQSLWVKVIGRLPNTGVNDKILIKLSTQAFSKLSPTDQRFRAEVSYIIR